MSANAIELREEVRQRYAQAALAVDNGGDCGCDCESLGCCGDVGEAGFGETLYAADERSSLPDAAVLASLGRVE